MQPSNSTIETTNSSISVVVPAFNEAEVLPEFHRRLSDVMAGTDMPWEVVYVNDGSTDTTWTLLQALSDTNAHVRALDLSRNFGKEVAMTAGIEHATGDAVVIIDADLQDPPELIPRLIEGWRDGFDNVFAQRQIREGETALKKMTAMLFYRIANRVSRVPIPADTGDFRLLSRRAVQAVLALREHHRFMKGIFAWIGYPQKAVLYTRNPRFAGKTKWNYLKLWGLAVEGLTSFTIAPLKLASLLGFMTSLTAFIYGLGIVYKTVVYGETVQGFPTLMVTILFLGGVQLLTLGVLGEYVGRTFNEVKRRPLYFVQRTAGSGLPGKAQGASDEE